MTFNAEESDLLKDFEADRLRSVANPAELASFRASAGATTIRDQCITIRLTAGDLRDLQVKAMQEGMPYQTLIASVLHKYVTGRLTERSPEGPSDPTKAALA